MVCSWVCVHGKVQKQRQISQNPLPKHNVWLRECGRTFAQKASQHVAWWADGTAPHVSPTDSRSSALVLKQGIYRRRMLLGRTLEGGRRQNLRSQQQEQSAVVEAILPRHASKDLSSMHDQTPNGLAPFASAAPLREVQL